MTKPIKQYSLSLELIACYDSIRAAARAVDVEPTSIRHALIYGDAIKKSVWIEADKDISTSSYIKKQWKKQKKQDRNAKLKIAKLNYQIEDVREKLASLEKDRDDLQQRLKECP